MAFEIRFVRGADDDVGTYAAHERRSILNGIDRYPAVDADVETRRRKHLRPNPLPPWELRIGSHCVFFEIGGNSVVRALTVGSNEHNEDRAMTSIDLAYERQVAALGRATSSSRTFGLGRKNRTS